MSIIKLGKLVTNVTYDDKYDYYVAAIIDSKSGFTYPKLIRNLIELDSYFGDFTYKKMYRDLLDKGIPVLLIPKLTPLSDYNRCTLRISCTKNGNDEFEYEYCHPKYSKPYTKLDNIRIAKGDETYNYVIDFSLIDFSKIRQYDEYETQLESTDVPYIILSKDLEIPIHSNADRRLLQLSHVDAPIAMNTNYYDAVRICLFNATGSDKEAEKSKVQDENNPEYYTDQILVSKIKEKIREGFDLDCVDIFDEMSELIDYTVPLYNYATLVDINKHLNDPQYENDEDWKEAFELEYKRFSDFIIGGVLSNTFLTDTSRNVADVMDYVLKLSKEYIGVIGIDPNDDVPGMICDVIKFYINYGVQGESNAFDQLNRYKIAIRYKNPTIIPYFDNINGLVSDSYEFYDDDIKAQITENDKLLEFYSKIKGERGSETKICIKKSDEEDNNLYTITISNGEIVEVFDVTISVPIMSNGFYDDGYPYIDTINQKSQLVGLRVFDYHKDGKYYNQYEVDIDYDDPEVYNNFTLRSLPIRDEDNPLTLSNYMEEYPRNSDIEYTMDILNSSDWYPDLLLVTEFNYSNFNSDYIDIIQNFCSNHKSQALINVDKYNFIEYNDSSGEFIFNDSLFTRKLKDLYGSRLLTFYGTLTIDDVEYPCLYPYITNILNSDFLEIPQDRILYNILPETIISKPDPEHPGKTIDTVIDEDYLKSIGVNYFDYNNLYYNYKSIREPNPSPDFHVIYCTSKISRVFLDNSNELINCMPSDFDYVVSELIRKAKNLLPLVTNVEYRYDFNGNQYNIELGVTITKLVNKKFVFNITLNII